MHEAHATLVGLENHEDAQRSFTDIRAEDMVEAGPLKSKDQLRRESIRNSRHESLAEFLAKKRKKEQRELDELSPRQRRRGKGSPKPKLHRAELPDYYKNIMRMKAKRVSYMSESAETDQSLILGDGSAVPEERETHPPKHIAVNLDVYKKDNGVKVTPGIRGKASQRINIDLINASEVKMPKLDREAEESPLRNMCDYAKEQKHIFNSTVDPRLITSVPSRISSHSPPLPQSPSEISNSQKHMASFELPAKEVKAFKDRDQFKRANIS